MKKITYLNQRLLTDFLNEKYSINNTIDQISQEIVDICMSKFDWWNKEGRKRKYTRGLKPGNFVDIFYFIPKTKDRKFNISRMNIKLVFVLSADVEINSSGYCFTFGEKTNPKKNKLSPKDTTLGLEVGMEIRIFVPRRSKKDFTQDVIEKIYEIGSHELTHLFQSYKIDQKGFLYEDYEVTTTILDFSYDIIGRYSGGNSNLFNVFTSLMYICLTKSETDAYLAQAGSKSNSGDFWVEYIDWFRSKSKSRILKNIKQEIESEISEKDFIEILHKVAEKNNADFSSIETIDDFLEWGYDVINRKKNYLIKKVGKIKYQKLLDSK
jgi:hypothetical protein